MKAITWLPLATVLCVLATLAARSATLYVWQASPHCAPPYATWTTAATNIQQAVDEAIEGDEIVVTNGVYQAGAREVYGMSNRVAVTKPVTVRSVNGPEVTIIAGYQVPGTTNGDEAVRCVCLTNGALLAGFTLTNGSTRVSGSSTDSVSGGGVAQVGAFSEMECVVSNCVIVGNAGWNGGGAYGCRLIDCLLSGNTAKSQGGGAAGCSLYRCKLANNSAAQGGGASDADIVIRGRVVGNLPSTLDDCEILGNRADWGGGASWGTLNNCTLAGNSASQCGGGVSGCTLNNCILTFNRAFSGGVIRWEDELVHGEVVGRKIIYQCELIDEATTKGGGGADNSALYNCTLTGNSGACGGGASRSVLNNCTVVDNQACRGGGAYASTLDKCTLAHNEAGCGTKVIVEPIIVRCRVVGYRELTYLDCAQPRQPTWEGGGGALLSTLRNCALSFNSAFSGGGAAQSSLHNCTVAGNWACQAGGTLGGAATNCIVYYNTASTDPNCSGTDLDYCCTTPLPANGTSNIASEPKFMNLADGDFRLRYGSPCLDAGTDLSSIITNDIDGRSRALDGNGDEIPAFDMGAYECTPTVRHVWQQSFFPTPPYDTWLTAATNIQDAVDAAEPGDLVLVAGGVYDSGGQVVETNLLLNRVVVGKPITVESLMGPEVTLIVGAVEPGGSTNGDGAIRCVYLTNGAILSGFTLTNGATRTDGVYSLEQSGGGVWCESTNALVLDCTLTGNSASEGGGVYGGTLKHCKLIGNSAWDLGGGASEATLIECTLIGNSAGSGGGASGGNLNICTLTTNSASYSGGGTYKGALNNCTLVGNSAYQGGGAYGGKLRNSLFTSNAASLGGGVFGIADCSSESVVLINCTLTGNSALSGGGACGGLLNNCIVYSNTAADGANYAANPDFGYWDNIVLNYCCTTPMPTNGIGNITGEPLFVDSSSGNLRLQSNSPCINSGNTDYVSTSTDLAGNPRIVNDRVDIGAYEFQGLGSRISYAWLQQYGLPTDGSVDFDNTDGDGLNNWQECQADTNPTNAASSLRLSIAATNSSVAVTFASSLARLYTLLNCTNLASETSDPTWTPVHGQQDVPGNGATLFLMDTNPAPSAFYRVSVRFR